MRNLGIFFLVSMASAGMTFIGTIVLWNLQSLYWLAGLGIVGLNFAIFHWGAKWKIGKALVAGLGAYFLFPAALALLGALTG